MPAPYSLDLRNRIIDTYMSGKYSVRKVAEMFSVGKTTITTYIRQYRLTGTVKAKPASGGRANVINLKGLSMIRKWVEKNPDITISNLCNKYLKKIKVKVSESMMCRALKRMNLRRKKKSFYAAEQERNDVKKKERNFYN